jgi:hypothetical protein
MEIEATNVVDAALVVLGVVVVVVVVVAVEVAVAVVAITHLKSYLWMTVAMKMTILSLKMTGWLILLSRTVF